MKEDEKKKERRKQKGEKRVVRGEEDGLRREGKKK
jgi:hypothetical protein